jgi:phosphate transport system protein
LAQQDVDTIDQQVLQLFAMVSEGLVRATEAFLDVDRDAARELLVGERSIDVLHSSTEALVERELERNLHWADAEVRHLVSVLRIVPELERSGDLVEHIAMRTPQGLAREITPQARGLVSEMGRIGAEMWREAANAYADRDGFAADRLRQRDDELDDLHVQLSRELADSGTSIPVAIEMGLIARFYERLGDHAVNVARRVQQVMRVGIPVEVR